MPPLSKFPRWLQVERDLLSEAMNKLPEELLDAIFALFDVSRDFDDLGRGGSRLSWNRESLSSCSLVCRRWTPLAQSHLFRCLFYILEQDDGDGDPHGDTPSNIHTEFQAIHTFFDTHRDLAACVRALRVTVAPIARHQCLFLPPWSHHLDPALLCSLLSTMPHVERLDLQDFVLKPPHLLPHQPGFALKTLKITSLAQTTRFSDILHLLGYFTDIDFLNLTMTFPDDDVPEASSSPARNLAIHDLTFQSAMCGAVCRYLAQSRSASTLHSLTLIHLLPRDMPQLNALLDVMQPNLRRLSLSFLAVPPAEPGNPPPLDLARLPFLQSLELSVWSSTEAWHNIWGILSTLSAMHNRTLQEATLVLRQPERFSADDAWILVPRALLSGTYATLCVLHKQGSFRSFTYREQGNGRVSHEAEMFPRGIQHYLHSAR